MKHKLQLVTAFFCGAIFFSGVSYAATELVAKPTNFKIEVNGVEQKLSNQPVTINNSTYLPVRAVGEITGFDVDFNNNDKVINLINDDYVSENNGGSGATVPNETNNTNGEYVSNLSTKYNDSEGKLDAELVKKAIESKEISVNAQDQTTGDSLLHLVIKQNNFAAYQVIKVKGIKTNLKNNEGNTPLHVSVIEQNGFYFDELTSEFREIQYKNNEGKFPIDYAKKNSSFEITLKFVDKAE